MIENTHAHTQLDMSRAVVGLCHSLDAQSGQVHIKHAHPLLIALENVEAVLEIRVRFATEMLNEAGTAMRRDLLRERKWEALEALEAVREVLR